MAERLGLTNVEFRGQLDNVEAIWAEHHALVLSSRFEGMPLVVVEAMLCGRPCIATDVGGNRELIRDGVNGFLAKAPTVELLDEAMNRAWENRNRLRAMGEVSARDVRQWVSADPGGDLARELTLLVGGEDSSAKQRDVSAIGAPIEVR
jgi:glycosyltransferase involved in cell wall biosynthesis